MHLGITQLGNNSPQIDPDLKKTGHFTLNIGRLKSFKERKDKNMEQKNSANSKVVVSEDFHGVDLSFESGWVAKQASGSVIVRAGGTMVLCTVCSADAREGQNFFPMTVEYQEKAYAAGKIPGGFFKREGRPGEQEILACRLIDRPIRPFWPKGYMNEVQIICSVLSYDKENIPYTLAICGASAALHISDLPFQGPIAAVRVGRVDGKLIINPKPAQVEKCDIDMIVAATKEAIVMVEGGAQFVPDKEVLEALYFGHEEIKKLIALQEDLRSKVGKEKTEFIPVEKDAALVEKVQAALSGGINEAIKVRDKGERKAAISELKSSVKESLLSSLGEEAFAEASGDISDIFDSELKSASRKMIVDEKIRIDGRDFSTVRPIECDVDVIPRAHGSSLFTRGETQAYVTTTLGTSVDSQRIDNLVHSDEEKTFLLHYNFPPYCTGEAKMLRGTSRREVGHGALAERALRPIVPSQKDFPYVLRIVSDITESNGSSSMASVCGGTLSMMQAGVPVKEPVSGIAMGLIKEGEKIAVLTDILGDEDHFGDMDFKVCGSKDGITALQMDIKCTGLSRETMEQALEQAREGRVHILDEMAKAISEPNKELSQFAPQIRSIKINPDKIRDIIGPGGKTIRSITESTGVKIDIEDNGTVNIASDDGESIKRAMDIIEGLTEEAEIGKIYAGVVKKVMNFGAFVEILPGVEGLCHISELENKRVEKVEDVVNEGEEVMVRVLDIDKQGKIRLSRKEALQDSN